MNPNRKYYQAAATVSFFIFVYKQIVSHKLSESIMNQNLEPLHSTGKDGHRDQKKLQ